MDKAEEAAIGILGTDAVLVCVAGVLCIQRIKNGQLNIAPITTQLASKLGFDPASQFAKTAAKQEKASQKLLSSGQLWDTKWLKKHIRVIGPNDVVENFTAKVIADIQKNLQYPSAQKRIADAFANPQGKGILTYQILEAQDMMPGAAGWGDASTSTQGIVRDTIDSDSFWSYTNPHETTHEGQLLVPAALNGRESAVYHDIIEGHARVEEYCNGLIEGRNPRRLAGGLGPDGTLAGILKEVDSQLSWDDFLQLQKKDPSKFNTYMKHIKERLFLESMATLPTYDIYTNNFLLYAWRAQGKGSIETMKEVTKYYAKQMGVDFNAIWPAIEGYATGKIKMPGIHDCFDEFGRPTDTLYNRQALTEYRLYKRKVEELETRYPAPRKSNHEEIIQKARNNLQSIQERSIKNSTVLREFAQEKGNNWVAANYEAILSAIDQEKQGIPHPSDLLSRRTITVDGEVRTRYDFNFFSCELDSNGRVLAFSRPQDPPHKKHIYNYDSKGRLTSVTTPAGHIVTDQSQLLDYLDYAEDARTMYMRDQIKQKLPADNLPREKAQKRVRAQARNVAASPTPIESHPAKKINQNQLSTSATPQGEPALGKAPSAKKQVAGAAVRLGAQTALVYGASAMAKRYQDWDTERQQQHLGALMGVSENTTLALQRANMTLGIGGALIAGAGVTLSIATAKGAKFAVGQTGKVAMKSIPVVGTVLGLGYATARACEGDWAGAGLELASASMDIVSAVGVLSGPGEGAIMAASVALDTYIAARDAMMKNGTCDFAMAGNMGEPVLSPDGQPVLGARINYKHDVKEGTAQFFGYGPNGSYLAVQGQFKDDQKEGEWISVSPDWNPEHPNEHILERANYHNGQLVGEYKRVDNDGHLIAEGNFTNGAYREWWTDENGHSTGVPKFTGHLKNGKRVGKWVSFSKDGKVTAYVDYDKKIIHRYLRQVDNQGKTHFVRTTEPLMLPTMGSAIYSNPASTPQEMIWGNSTHNPVPTGLSIGGTEQSPTVRDLLPDFKSIMEPPKAGQKDMAGLSKKNLRQFGNGQGLDDQLSPFAEHTRQIGNGKGIDDAIAKVCKSHKTRLTKSRKLQDKHKQC